MWAYLLYVAAFTLLYNISTTVFSALVFGWYLSMIIDVPARLIGRIRFISYRVGVLISSILVFALLALCFGFIIPVTIEEGGKLFEIITDSVRDIDLRETIAGLGISTELFSDMDKFTNDLVGRLANTGLSFLNSFVGALPGALTAAVLFFITASYLTSLMPAIRANLWRLFPTSTGKQAVRFLADFYKDVRRFIGGQLIIALCIGVITGVGLAISGIPYAFFLGVISGVTNFIPYLGVIVAGFLAALLGLSHQGLWGLVKVLGVIVVANQVEAWVLSPKIQGDRMNINWFVILVAMFLFGSIYGFVGILLAIPILVFMKKFWIEYVQEAMGRL